jgi:hypothetical protein
MNKDMVSGPAHLTKNGHRRKSVHVDTVVGVWLDDCQGALVAGTVVTDLCWGNLIVRIEGRQARVSWSDGHGAYLVTNRL